MTTMREALDEIAASLTPEENETVETMVRMLEPYWQPLSPSAQKGFEILVAEVYAELLDEREGRE